MPPRVPDRLEAMTAGFSASFDPQATERSDAILSSPARLALVGCGRIAQVAHLPAVEKAEGVELVAVSDPSGAVARSVAHRYGVAAA
jgi:glutamate dehydrogenase/leucine dehydrogenase